MGSISHSELCSIAVRWLRTHGCLVVVKERSSNGTAEIPDAIGFMNRGSILIECKASRSDFLADSKKWFRDQEYEERGMGKLRYYMSEPDIINACEVPAKWGLIHVKDGKARIAKHCDENGFKVNYQAEKSLLYAILRGLIPHERDGVWEFIAKEPNVR